MPAPLPPSVSSASSAPPPDPLISHRFEVRRRALLPLVMGMGAVGLLAASVFTLPPSSQTHMVNFMWSCLCLLPLVLCFLPVYLSLVTLIFYVGRLNGGAESRLQRIYALSETLKTRTTEATDNVNQRVLNLSVALARLDPLFRIFDSPDKPSDPQP